jgi:hypothetical protein
MKHAPLFAFLLFVACSLSSRADSTISVSIAGAGVNNPGNYTLKSGATLQDLLSNDKAQWMRSSNGTFQITRFVKNEKTVIDVNYEHWDIKLLDGDIINAPGMQIKAAEQGAAANP